MRASPNNPYGIQVYGGVWGLDNLSVAEGRTKSFTKGDNHNLQVVMNKVLRSLTGLKKETPVNTLLQQSGYLSVQQLTAYHCLTTMHKIVKNEEPVHLYNIISQSRSTFNRTRTPAIFHPRNTLSTSRQGFMHQGQKLYNLLPENVLTSGDIPSFKRNVKTWIKLNIPALPP